MWCWRPNGKAEEGGVDLAVVLVLDVAVIYGGRGDAGGGGVGSGGVGECDHGQRCS